MPDIQNWLTTADHYSDAYKAGDTASRIAEHPTSITLNRGGVAQAAQTVRLAPLGSGSDRGGAGGNITPAAAQVLIIGYRGHDEIADTNIQRGDQFYHSGQWFDVVWVDVTVDYRLLAAAEARV